MANTGKHTKAALYESAAATIGALDLGRLFGDDMFDVACDDQAMLSVMTEVQRDIVKRIRGLRRTASKEK